MHHSIIITYIVYIIQDNPIEIPTHMNVRTSSTWCQFFTAFPSLIIVSNRDVHWNGLFCNSQKRQAFLIIWLMVIIIWNVVSKRMCPLIKDKSMVIVTRFLFLIHNNSILEIISNIFEIMFWNYFIKKEYVWNKHIQCDNI